MGSGAPVSTCTYEGSDCIMRQLPIRSIECMWSKNVTPPYYVYFHELNASSINTHINIIMKCISIINILFSPNPIGNSFFNHTFGLEKEPITQESK